MIQYNIVIGLRCSGTNYLQELMSKNFPNILKYPAWKHGKPETQIYPLTDRVLYLIIVRNPYDWLQSLYGSEHTEVTQYKSFDDFLINEWNAKSMIMEYKTDNKTPKRVKTETTEHYKNIFHLRYEKTTSFLQFVKHVPKYKIIKYEDLKTNPEKIIKNIASEFQLQSIGKFIPINYYKKYVDQPFKPKKYNNISKDNLKIINDNINWNQEKQFNYIKINSFRYFE